MEYSIGKSKIYIILVHFKPIATITGVVVYVTFTSSTGIMWDITPGV